MALTKDDVIEALRQVEDPELGMDIVDLGLLYDVDIDGSKVKVIHSLTSMGCPAGPMIQEDIHRVASEVPGVEDVEIELTWDPPWSPEKMSEDAKFLLGFGSPGILRTIFPSCSPASRRSCAARASLSGKTSSSTG